MRVNVYMCDQVRVTHQGMSISGMSMCVCMCDTLRDTDTWYLECVFASACGYVCVRMCMRGVVCETQQGM